MLNPDYRDMLSAFCENDVEFLVVGAYALAAHGLPRATGDIDLWIARSEENASRVLKALAQFGVPDLGWTTEDFQRSDMVFQIGLEPRRIDILTSMSGVEFHQAWSRRVIVQIDELGIPFISPEDLIASKEAAGTPSGSRRRRAPQKAAAEG